jgi:uroporphyrinogen III methyltransferase/synthase
VKPRPTGRVALVGAGPGDPDLITVRGLALLQRADAVVYDSLASRELLAHVRAGAETHDVGKRGHDAPTRPQSEINALVVALARAGKLVVRLKGGDPFVFGRGGEEASACAEAGVPFEVVPGVSSALAAPAAAGIPLTDRRHAASFAVVTGHKDPTRVSEATRWAELARSVDTLVILMGARKLPELVERIVAGGHDPKTPAAMVMNGTLPSQRVVTAPLGELPARVRDAGLGAPAAVVIGDVVRLREQLAWLERRPLFGRRVLVTRDPAQAAPLVAALREAGAEAVVAPMIRVVPPERWDELDAALDRLGGYDALLFTSANAVRFLVGRAGERGVALPPLRAFCVGRRSADAARRAGFAVAGVPSRRHDAAALLDEIGARFPPAGRRFLFPCADRARDVLPSGLAAAGAEVDVVTAYRTLEPELDRAGLSALLADARLDALTFASPSAARHFAARLDDASRAAARRCIVAAIGPVTAEALREVGLPPDVTTGRADAEELVAALCAHVVAGGPGGSP